LLYSVKVSQVVWSSAGYAARPSCPIPLEYAIASNLYVITESLSKNTPLDLSRKAESRRLS
jgi:hypothetical protein